MARRATARKAPRQDASDTADAFLGVTASARGYTWRERLESHAASTAIAISQRHGVPELLGRVLAARGVGLDEVPDVLTPTIKALMPDPSTLVDMDKAAGRLADAIQRREQVAVFGDYDVDGACSAALIRRFLLAHDLDATIYIPDRMFEGYGPNIPAIKGLVEKGAQLIVTVDCGTTSFEPLAPEHRPGVDVLVVDHHQADERLPEVTALVNPNRQDDLSGLGHLCAAGVVFMLLVATARELRQRGHYGEAIAPPDLIGMLDLVALATVCDVVPLKSLNRAYVTRGLEVMRQRRNIGLRALIDAAGIDPRAKHEAEHIRRRRLVDAGGRIGDAALGARLLSLDDETEAARIAVQLDKLNRERKTIETQMLDEAVAEADRLVDETPDLPMLVVASERWHKGVVGLVASRLVERFGRPACVIAWEEGGQGTGSLRSIADVDIGAAVRAAAADSVLLKGGGHAMAAGLTVARDKFDVLRNYLATALKSPATAARAARALEIDGALTPAAVSDTLIDLIERAGPYGQGNPPPRFVFPAHRVRFAKVMGEAHLRVTLEADDGSRLEAIAFRAVGQPLGDLLTGTGGMPIHVAGSLRRDTWGGRNRIELQIEDAADPRRQD